MFTTPSIRPLHGRLIVKRSDPETRTANGIGIGIGIDIDIDIGVLFGYFPARRAARMDPIKALRHE